MVINERVICRCKKIFIGNDKWKEFKEHKLICKLMNDD